MNLKKIAGLVSAALIAASVAAPSFAATASFTKQKALPYVSTTGATPTAYFSTLTSDFPSGTSSSVKKITSLQYSYAAYANGSTQTVVICMTNAYAQTYDVCQDISTAMSGTASAFVGKTIAPGKDIVITHTLIGGTYPTAAPAAKDQITVNFSY